MQNTTAVFVTLLVYNAVLIGVGMWARGRNQGVADFYLGGRGLGAWTAALSASASSSSAWTLLGVSGAAYAWGTPALWLFPATVGGFVFNWLWVAPRLQRLSRDEDAVTLSAVVAPAQLVELRTRPRWHLPGPPRPHARSRLQSAGLIAATPRHEKAAGSLRRLS